jgi:hypothetical protein
MPGVEPARAQCPFCGEAIELLIDPSVGEQRYIEDCEVCCRPMNIVARIDETGQAVVEVFR